LEELDGVLGLGLVEARPAAVGLELRVRAEPLGAARTARVDALARLPQEVTGPGALGALLAQHVVLLGREELAPLLVGPRHLVRHARPADVQPRHHRPYHAPAGLA